MLNSIHVAMESSGQQFVSSLYNEYKQHFDFRSLTIYMRNILQSSTVAYSFVFTISILNVCLDFHNSIYA